MTARKKPRQDPGTHPARRVAPEGRPPIDELLAFAHRLADRAGTEILPHFRRRIDVDNKAGSAGFDPVTEGDRAAEQAIRAMVRDAYPGHGILGEEFANAPSSSRYCWIIDPIDGTRAFIMGYPVWGSLISLAIDGRPVIGIIDQPFTRERYWGAAGRGEGRSPMGTTALRTRRCARLEDAIFATTTPDMFKDDFERGRFEAIRRRSRMTRYGGDCYSYCMLASGYVDLIVEASLKPFDIGALVPVIEAAGGVITGWDGGPPLASTRIVAAGDPALHEQALALLAKSA